MNWETGTWDSGFWDAPASDYFLASTKSKKQNKMKRQNFYPSRIGDQVNWLDNFGQNFPLMAPLVV
jgi:hypothetical protein